MWVRFGFPNEYKNTNDKTKALFVDDPPFPALISQDRKLKRAKRPDGLWGFHVHGKLGRLRYDPTAKDPKGSSTKTAQKSSAKDDDDDDDLAAAPKPTPKRPTPTPKKPVTPRNAAQPMDTPEPPEPREPREAPPLPDLPVPPIPAPPPTAEAVPEPPPPDQPQPEVVDVQPDQQPPPPDEPR